MKEEKKDGKLDLKKLREQGSMHKRDANEISHLKRKVIPSILRDSGAKSDSDTRFCGNEIITARYTKWSFIPVSLLVQYTRVGVVFWTFNSLLMTWDAISTNDPLLVFFFVFLVIALGMLKEWISDNKRSKEDKRINESKFTKIVVIKST